MALTALLVLAPFLCRTVAGLVLVRDSNLVCDQNSHVCYRVPFCNNDFNAQPGVSVATDAVDAWD